MKQRIKPIAKRIMGHGSTDNRLNPDKKAIIDFACEWLNMRSFVDLGAVWNVDGG